MITERNAEERRVTELYLIWIGDLEKDAILSSFTAPIIKEEFNPKAIVLNARQNRITVGSQECNAFGDYQLNSVVCTCKLDSKHTTFLRLPSGKFRLLDHSEHGTFLNYRKVSNSADLSQGDIICFGHPAPRGIVKGAVVEPFYWDLKYKVFIGCREEVLLEIDKAVKRGEIQNENIPITLQVKIADVMYRRLSSTLG